MNRCVSCSESRQWLNNMVIHTHLEAIHMRSNCVYQGNILEGVGLHKNNSMGHTIYPKDLMWWWRFILLELFSSYIINQIHFQHFGSRFSYWCILTSLEFNNNQNVNQRHVYIVIWWKWESSHHKVARYLGIHDQPKSVRVVPISIDRFKRFTTGKWIEI